MLRFCADAVCLESADPSSEHRYGTKEQRGRVIQQFYGNVRKLIKNRTAAPVLAMAYIDFATSEQRSSLLQEFYGQ